MSRESGAVLAIIPLDIYGHKGVTIMTELKEENTPEGVIEPLKPYKFEVAGVTVSTRLLYLSDSSEEGHRQGYFHPICLRLVRQIYPSWRKISSTPIGVLKDELVNEGWAVTLPI